MRRRFTYLALVIALCVSAYLLFRQTPSRVESKKKTYNLIFISIDTVRTDYLQLYNPEGAPTPNLNRIAEKATVFSDVISQIPFTLPSHATMLTGTYPMKHLVQENTHDKLPDSAVTLAETLKANGYNTAGFIGCIVLGSAVGMNQGFDTYDDLFTLSDVRFADIAGVQKTADDVYNSFQRWFDKRPPGKFFAFVHFYDAHAPYEPPEPFRPASNYLPDLYKGELRYVDSVIGKMYDRLTSQGVWNDTILVITGDHGEMFGEHKEMGHGYFIYQQALKVPLLIVIPGQAGMARQESPVQLVDLMPTMLDLLGVPVPKEVQGHSFEPLLEGKTIPPRFAISESLSGSQNFGTAPLRSIEDSTFKYIDSARPEFYNIKSDPLESNNLLDEKKDLADKMKAKLAQMVAAFSADAKTVAQERKLSPEESEQFAALGYIGESGAARSVDPSRDAKDYIGYWNDLIQVNTLLKDGKAEDALALIQKMRKADALPVSAHIFEARAYVMTHQFATAVPILEAIVKDDPENSQALNTLADAYEEAGYSDKAVATYKLLVEQQGSMIALQNYARHMTKLGKPEEIVAYLDQLSKAGKLTGKYDEVLGEIYLNLGQTEKARAFLQKAIETNPESYRSYLLLSNSFEKSGDKQAALKILEDTGGKFQQADFLCQLGLLYHRTGDPQKEMDTFVKMIDLHKRDSRGYFYLGKMLLDRGGPYDKVLELAQKGLELKPSPDFQIFGNYLMGDALTNLGDKVQAESYYEKAKQLSLQQGGTNHETK